MKITVKFSALSIFLVCAMAIGAGTAQARGTVATAWSNAYPGSNSLQNVVDGTGKSCSFCHENSSGGGSWNAYGWAMRVAGLDFATIEGDDSDGNGDSNIAEITANTQPGWTNGANTIYLKSGGTFTTYSAMPGILGSLDPSTGPADADSDGYDETVDCNDNDPAVNPGAAEICGDGIDNDCAGGDEACPNCDFDGDGFDAYSGFGCFGNDCNDYDPAVNPGATEICGDGIDNDCVGGDETCAPVDADGDGWDETVDCNDSDPAINPGAAEICGDGIDNDCTGGDEACPNCDVDGDGFDAYSGFGFQCFGNDCNDYDPAVNPGAAEVCGDGIDNDCVGGDEACPPVDADGDGYDETADCNDNDPAINPGALEAGNCTDATDNDCNGDIDCLDIECGTDPACDTTPTCTDVDGDGYSVEGGDCGPADCVDSDPSINPGACDIKSDGIDQDCSGKDRTKGKACPGSEPPVEDPEICDDGIDNDGDGKTDCSDRDCRNDAACSGGGEPPADPEICDDGIDNDGDNKTDCRDRDCRNDPAC